MYSGASSSNIVIVTTNGEIISRADGLGTNHWVNMYLHYILIVIPPQLDGMDVCLKRINDMVVEAKKNADIPLDKPLKGLVSQIALMLGHCYSDDIQGLSLSGAEKKEAQVAFVTGMKEKYPSASEVYHVCTDTFGSIATVSETGENLMYILYSTKLWWQIWQFIANPPKFYSPLSCEVL